VAAGRKICLLNALMCCCLALKFDAASSSGSSTPLCRANRLSLIKVNECLGDLALTEITAAAKRVEARFVLASCVRLWPLFVYSS
jgi:hypothetical protein